MPKTRSAKPIADAEWFKARIEQVGLTQRSVAELIGRNVQLINKKIGGGRTFSIDEIPGLVTALRTTPEELLRRLGYDVPEPTVLVTGRVTGEAQISAITDGHAVAAACCVPDDATALVFDTEGSALDWADGARVLYVPSAQGVVPADAFEKLSVIESPQLLVPVLGVIRRSVSGNIPIELFQQQRTVQVRRVTRAARVLKIIFD